MCALSVTPMARGRSGVDCSSALRSLSNCGSVALSGRAHHEDRAQHRHRLGPDIGPPATARRIASLLVFAHVYEAVSQDDALRERRRLRGAVG